MKLTLEHIILIFVFLAIALILLKPFSKSYTIEEDAKKYILDDAHSKYPNADVIEILSFEDKGSYYHAKVRVSIGLNTSCPTRIHIYYNYPEQNFVPEPPEYIVHNCSFSSSKILFPEEAIVYSYKLNRGFVDSTNAVPFVTFNNSSDVWTVVWKSNNSSIISMFDDEGNIKE